jgi:hypothetical protein
MPEDGRTIEDPFEAAHELPRVIERDDARPEPAQPLPVAVAPTPTSEPVVAPRHHSAEFVPHLVEPAPPGHGTTSAEQASIGAGDPAFRPPGTCTPAQLRRFIKSRPWIPMHELRRRFAINGPDDEVTRVELEGGSLFVGLPAREGQILGDLVRAGEVGYELSRDPTTPVIVGVYPMRPVPRL